MQILQLLQFIAITFYAILEEGMRLDGNLALFSGPVAWVHYVLPQKWDSVLLGRGGAWGRGNGICLTPKMISLDAKFSHTQASHHRGLSYLFLTSSLKYWLLKRTERLFFPTPRQYLFPILKETQKCICVRRQPSRHGCPECRHRQRRFLQIIPTKGQALGWPLLLMYWPQQHVAILFWGSTLCSLIK